MGPLVSSPWARLATAAAAAALVVLAVAAPVGAAGPPTLVKDINPTGSSNPTALTLVGNTLFFAADDGVHGVELWKTDGTLAGTKMVKDIRAGAKSSEPGSLTAVGDTLFFTAVDGVHGRELWKSDGTKAGTVMVKDINPHPKNSYCGNGIYMPYPPVAVGNRLYFFLHCGGVWSGTAWVSDGTAAGTYWLNAPHVAYPDDEDGENRVADALGNRLYFIVNNDANDDEIWVSDGTDSGTHRMAGSPMADQISFLPAHGQNLYFSTSDYVPVLPTEVRLWKTDGTKAGTKPLTDFDEISGAPDQAVLMGTRLYFANDAALWKTNGTASGTIPISNGGVSFLTTAGGRLYFTRGSHLWKSDGTAIGTLDVGQFGTQWPSELVDVGGTLCFIESDWDANTWSLWESNGTASTTYSVKSFVAPPDEFQRTAMNGRLYFAADDGTHGVELWSYTP